MYRCFVLSMYVYFTHTHMYVCVYVCMREREIERESPLFSPLQDKNRVSDWMKGWISLFCLFKWGVQQFFRENFSPDHKPIISGWDPHLQTVISLCLHGFSSKPRNCFLYATLFLFLNLKGISGSLFREGKSFTFVV